MKLSIIGASHWVNRMFEACGPFQWARELLKNSLEANATRVEFGIDWQAVQKLGVYRRTIADNGSGMAAEELERFFSTLGEGNKKIGGVHDNFGVGAKIAALPWNPQGLVVLSRNSGKSAMIWIVLDSGSGDYELKEFVTEDKRTCVIDPTQVDWEATGEIDWSLVFPEWIKEQGTVVVLMGSEEYPDTVLGNPQAGEGGIKRLSVYLNTRFWDLLDKRVTVSELRSEKKTQWPQGPEERDDSRRANNRRIMGARHFLTDIPAPSGKLAESGVIRLDEGRVEAFWYLWQGARPSVHTYAKESGYIAVRYRDELFEVTSNKAHFRWFGVIEGQVQQNLFIVLEPPLYLHANGRWGIHPDQSRNRLNFTGNGDKGVVLPLSEWGSEFAENMPEAIRQAISAARGEFSGSIDDDEYRKRLQDKFGNRWRIKVLARAKKGEKNGVIDSTIGDEEVDVIPQPPPDIPRKNRRRHTHGTKTNIVVVRKKAVPGGTERGIELSAPVDVPRYQLAHKDDFDKPWHLAAWNPHDPDGPTVFINVDSPILEDIVKYHQNQYADIHAQEVAKVVHGVFGEVAACKIAHSQKLAKTELTEEELNDEYRSEEALTMSLMGLIAEETLIAQRCGKFGPKKSVAA
jgi:Histidine kinase-, DNA gyrase B-, and HSP90-like ATPase